MQDGDGRRLLTVSQDILDHVLCCDEQPVAAYVETRTEQVPSAGGVVLKNGEGVTRGVGQRAMSRLEVPGIRVRLAPQRIEAWIWLWHVAMILLVQQEKIIF